MAEIWRWSARALAEAIRTRSVSSRETVEAILQRLDAVNPAINAVVHTLHADALAAADAADAAVKRGGPIGPLHGVPVTIKVNTDQQGCATTNGVVAFRDLVAKADSPSVANWRKAGAIIVGRTNTPCFSWRWFTDNELHGATRNPAAPDRTPGGSSGGAAAAVATGIGPLAHGTDYGGSIRYPAYACGVAGIRPTHGRIPWYNSSGEERPPTAQLMSVHGPIARRIADLRIGLGAMAAPDPHDVWHAPVPLDGPPPPRPIKVALTTGGVRVHPGVADAVRKAGRWLVDAGYAVEEVETPSLAAAAELWLQLVLAEGRHALLPLIEKLGDRAAKRAAENMGADVPALDMPGYMRALARRATLLREWLLFLERYPIVLMPVCYEPPFPNGLDQEGPDAMRRILAAQEPQLALPLLGLPGLAVPTGAVDGAPMGVQLVASRFREDLCLAAGEVIEARADLVLPIDPK
jgi:amidase